MEGVKADQNGKQPYDDPAYNLDGIILTLETLKKETEAIFNRPPPKKEEPPKEEAPKDAEMKEGEEKADAPAEDKKEGDAEMKDETDKAE